MQLPVMPPVSTMLATLDPEVPEGDYLYEPKWELVAVGSTDSCVGLRLVRRVLLGQPPAAAYDAVFNPLVY